MEEQREVITDKTEIIQNPQVVHELLFYMINSAKKEILLLLPTINAFLRHERLGIIELLKRVAIQNNVSIKILSPVNDFICKIIQSIKDTNGKLTHCFDLRSYEEMATTTVTIIIVDKKASLAIEKPDDSKENFIEAIGSSSYSTSKPIVSSYTSIFEGLWVQAKVYEELKIHNKMQQEFISVAAHELRTPVQSILGYTELVKDNIKDIRPTIQALLDIIYRNAIRLHRLTTELVDVTRIENHTLKLNKIRFNLEDVIVNVIDEIQGNPMVNSNNAKILYKPNNEKEGVGEEDRDIDKQKQIIFVEADMDRITQVVTNLLDNALKFTAADDYVSISLERKKDDTQGGLGEVVTVDVKDTGSGIDLEIFPRLFTKFASKSFEGIGLGLYISKGIIEAHGGKISVKNNGPEEGGNGATFSFTLPLVKRE